jgi:hypothetical protein
MNAPIVSDDRRIEPADVVRRTSRGTLVGTFPAKLEGQDVYSAKAPSLDLDARYDFELLIHIVRSGDLAIITQAIPLAEDGLLIATRSNDYFVTISDTYVRKIKIASARLGVARIDQHEAAEYYSHFVQAFFGVKSTILRYDADLNLVEEKTVAGFQFPPPPHRVAGAARALTAEKPRETPLDDAKTEGRIWFPEVAALGDGDYEVDGGHIVAGGDDDDGPDTGPAAFAPASAEPPGIYIDVLTQHDPPFAASIIRVVDGSGASKVLSGTYCTRSDTLQLWTLIKKKTKRSWFRKKTTITEIRKSLHVVTGGCHSMEF